MNHFLLDGAEVPFTEGDTLMDAAQRAGHAIAHLCWDARLGQSGACRLCTVRIDGRLAAACTTRAQGGQVVENRTPSLTPGACGSRRCCSWRATTSAPVAKERRLPAPGHGL